MRKKIIIYNSPVILTYSIISLVVLILGMATDYTITYTWFAVYRSGWGNPFTYLRMFTHIIGHASVQHYVSNFMYILLLGPSVEERYGSRKLLAMILLTALVIGLVFVAFNPTGALLGASGIVFMLIILASATNFSRGQIPMTMIMIALIYIGSEIYSGVTSSDSVSQLSHILGGVMGIIFALTMPKKGKA
ncbi:MAG: rhomboid family intramembrane serine protease [Oscillospiraceae bacterium]